MELPLTTLLCSCSTSSHCCWTYLTSMQSARLAGWHQPQCQTAGVVPSWTIRCGCRPCSPRHGAGNQPVLKAQQRELYLIHAWRLPVNRHICSAYRTFQSPNRQRKQLIALHTTSVLTCAGATCILGPRACGRRGSCHPGRCAAAAVGQQRRRRLSEGNAAHTADTFAGRCMPG